MLVIVSNIEELLKRINAPYGIPVITNCQMILGLMKTQLNRLNAHTEQGDPSVPSTTSRLSFQWPVSGMIFSFRTRRQSLLL
jgi:hypothetical protein